MSTDQILTTYLIFHALFDGGVFEISYKGLHDLHGLYFPTNIFSIFLQFLLFFFYFSKKSFKFVGRKIYDVTKRERKERADMKYFSKNKFWSVNTNYKNLPCLDKIKTKKAFFDLSHVKALITDFKNTTIEESMKN